MKMTDTTRCIVLSNIIYKYSMKYEAFHITNYTQHHDVCTY